MADIIDEMETDKKEESYAAIAFRRLQTAQPLLVWSALGLFVLVIIGQIGPIAAFFFAFFMMIICVSVELPGQKAVANSIVSKSSQSGQAFETYSEVLNAVSDPILLLDNRGSIQFANVAAQDQLGSVAAGASAIVRFRAPDLQDMLRETMAGRRHKPVTYVERHGQEHWFSVSMVPLEGLAGEGYAFLLRFVDQSEPRRLERMRSAFIANASHELRTPLASLNGFIETLKGPAKDDVKAHEEFLGIMHDQTARMSRLVDDLLSLSRFETSRGISEFAPTDLADPLRHVINALHPIAQEIGLSLELDIDEDCPDDTLVLGNRDELIQLFENLVENAIKYGADGNKVRIGVRRDIGSKKPSYVVTVQDFGMGIDPRHLPRLTERFYRVDEEESRVKQGTGLGLAIVKHITTRHNGKLTIESTPGEGTEFHVHLPISHN